MGFPVNILIVDDNDNFLEEIRNKTRRISTQMGYLYHHLNIQLASNFIEAARTLDEAGDSWDVLITNIALGEPANATVKGLGVRLVKSACENGLETVVVSATKDGDIVKQLYQQLKIRDLLFKSNPNFEQRFEECMTTILVEELKTRPPESLLPLRKILFLSANTDSSSYSMLVEEVRDIQSGMERALNREQFTFKPEWAMNSRDVLRAMIENKPQIVHFSGHREGNSGLYFSDSVGNANECIPVLQILSRERTVEVSTAMP